MEIGDREPIRKESFWDASSHPSESVHPKNTREIPQVLMPTTRFIVKHAAWSRRRSATGKQESLHLHLGIIEHQVIHILANCDGRMIHICISAHSEWRPDSGFRWSSGADIYQWKSSTCSSLLPSTGLNGYIESQLAGRRHRYSSERSCIPPIL